MPSLAKEPAPQVSIVIPCYNEEEVLEQTLERVFGVCQENGYDAEVICVDDGSADGTWATIERQSRAHPRLVGLKLSRNFGHQQALSAGLYRARGQRILILDADLQDPPELLPAMMARMDEGVDTVFGQRRSRRGETWLKKLTAALFYRFINWLSDHEIPKDTGDFRLMSRRVLEAWKALPEDKRFNRLLFAWVGFKASALPYERAERAAGVTKYNYRKMLRLAVDGITSFSIRPLKIALLFAFTMVVAAGVGIFWAVYSKVVLGGTFPGWASQIVLTLLVGACQLFVLGIIGEYLGRLFIENKRRPTFIVAEECASGAIAPPQTPFPHVSVRTDSAPTPCEAAATVPPGSPVLPAPPSTR